jgi:hypothetical protein
LLLILTSAVTVAVSADKIAVENQTVKKTRHGKMTEYQHEQLQALTLVAEHLAGLGGEETDALKRKLSDYLIFRKETGKDFPVAGPDSPLR